MRSSELADLAGVTVRTLRHYHQRGVLPEPPRTSAGYRIYDVSHLVRLLRITRMTALGVPLASLPDVIDDAARSEDLLDDLDRQAAREIELLTARRRSIAALRRAGVPPDVPPELAGWYTPVHDADGAEPSVPPAMRSYERELIVLLGHLLGDDGPSRMASLYELLADSDEVGDEDGDEDSDEGSDGLEKRFYSLPDDADEGQIAELAETMGRRAGAVASQLDELVTLGPDAVDLVEQLGEATLNSAQLRVLEHLGDVREQE